MTTSATNPNYYIAPGALSFSENANASSEYVVVSTYARTLMRVAPVKVDNVEVIGWSADLEYKQWQLTGKNTKFNPEYANSSLNIYVRLNLGDTSDALIFFTPKALDVLGNEVNDGEIVGEPITPATATYAYIQIGTVTAPTNGLREIHYDSGNLGTAKGNTENPSGALAEMFQIVYQNAVKLIQPQLDFVNIAIRDSIKLGNKLITAISDSIAPVAAEARPSTLPTVKAVIDYIAHIVEGLANKFLSKEHDDATPYKLTMREAEVVEDAGVGGDLTVLGDAAVGGKTSTAALEVIGHGINDRAVFHVPLESDNFNTGFAGWQLDRNGNLEVETVHARSAIITDELRINRQQAQEGDTMFTDNDQIELVTPIFAPATPQSGDNPSAKGWYERTEDGGNAVYTLTTDTSVVAGKTYYYIDSYILDLKEKWDGYFTAQQVGNILRGKINTLAAKEAGVSDYTAPEYAPSQQQDAGGNKYYTSFLAVINTHNTAPSLLSTNQIQVSLYGDTMVPMARNYPPCALMTVARWGCYLDPAESGITDDERRSRMRRQSLFMISTSDGHLVKLHGVNKPILEDFNFGTTLGDLPTFIKNNPNIQTIYGQDYLYAQGIIVEDYIKIDVHGVPEKKVVAFKEWVNGAATGTVIIPVWDEQQQEYVDTPFPLPIPQSELSNPASPYIGYGIYLAGEQNMLTRDYEIHDVYYYGMRWRTRQHIPVIDQQGVHFYEPKWNSPYWDIIEGDERLTMKITSSNGFGFRRGYVNTLATPIVFYGSIDISDDLLPAYWNWYRCEEVNWNGGNPTYTPADEHWNETHRGMRAITITDEDMPPSWGRANKIIFTCVATVNNGRQTLNVPNSIRL